MVAERESVDCVGLLTIIDFFTESLCYHTSVILRGLQDLFAVSARPAGVRIQPGGSAACSTLEDTALTARC